MNAKGDYDSVFSVTRLQTRFYWEDGSPINHNPNELLRTQDLPAVFEENSNFFIFTKDSFNSVGKKRIGKKPLMFPMGKIESQDIDEPEDFSIRQAMAADTFSRVHDKFSAAGDIDDERRAVRHRTWAIGLPFVGSVRRVQRKKVRCGAEDFGRSAHDSVTDNRGRVHGIPWLRVAEALSRGRGKDGGPLAGR